MGIYVNDNGTVREARMSHLTNQYGGKRLPLLGFVRGEDGTPKKFYDFVDDINHLEVRVTQLYLDGSLITDATQLAQYGGSLSVANSGNGGYVLLTMSTAGHNATVYANCYLHVKSSDAVVSLAQVFSNRYNGQLDFQLSVTGYLYFSGRGYGRYNNMLNSTPIVDGDYSSSKTVTKTFTPSSPTNNGSFIYLYNEIESGYGPQGNRMTINSVKLGGKTIPLQFTINLS